MIDPGSLAFDIDGVVADTMRLFIDIAREDYDIDGIPYAGFTSYNLSECLDMEDVVLEGILNRIQDGDYTVPLRPMEGAVEVLGHLAENFGPVLFVTARPYPGPIVDWLMERISLAPSDLEVVTTGSFSAKTEVLTERGITWFVEDRLETCFLLKESGITPVVYKQPWNRRPHPFLEVAGWQELKGLMAA